MGFILKKLIIECRFSDSFERNGEVNLKEDANKTLKMLYLAKRLVFVTIIIYIVVFFVVNSSYLSADNIERFTFTLKKTLTESYAEGTQKRVALMYDEGAEEISFKDGFAVLSTGTLTIYSADMVKFSSHSIGYKQPVLLASANNLICFDLGGKKLSVFDSFDQITEKTFKNNILNVAVSDSGYTAVITEEYGYKGLVTVYNDDFKEVMQWYSADYYLMYLGFTQRNTVSVVAVKPNNENIDTYVIDLNYKVGEERRVVCAENRFPMSAYVKNDSFLEIVSDLDIITFRDEGYETLFNYGSAEILTYKQFDQYTVVVAVEDSVKNLYRITVIDTDGNKEFEKIFIGYRDIEFFNGYFFVLGNGTVTTVGLEGQEVGLLQVSPDVFKILVSRGFALLIEPEQINEIDSSELFEYHQTN